MTMHIALSTLDDINGFIYQNGLDNKNAFY